MSHRGDLGETFVLWMKEMLVTGSVNRGIYFNLGTMALCSSGEVLWMPKSMCLSKSMESLRLEHWERH